MDKDAVMAHLVPAVEKLFLRSPECILHTLEAIVGALTFDATELAKLWLNPIMAQLKSTNEVVRSDALDLWRQLMAKSLSVKSADIEPLLKQLSTAKGTTVEQRFGLFKMLGAVAAVQNADVLQTCLDTAIPLVEKEGTLNLTLF
jgi:hypothetical protein